MTDRIDAAFLAACIGLEATDAARSKINIDADSAAAIGQTGRQSQGVRGEGEKSPG